MGEKGQKAELPITPGKVQRVYEQVLECGLWILACCHLLLSLCRYVFDFYNAARPYECRYFLILIAASVVYLFLCLVKWRGSFSRVKIFLKKFCSPAQIICFFFLFWYVLSCLINELSFIDPYFRYNDWWLLDTAVNCIILFSFPGLFSEEKAKKRIDLLLHVISLVWTAFSVFGLWTLFHLNIVKLPSGSEVGITRDSEFVLGCHYNISAAMALCFILIAFYMLASQKTPIKILYGFVLVIHTFVLLMTNSRAAFVACLSAYAAALFLILWNSFKAGNAVIRIAVGTAISAAAVGLLWEARSGAFQLFEAVTHFSDRLTGKSGALPLFMEASAAVAPIIPGFPAGKIDLCLFLLAFPNGISKKFRKILSGCFSRLAGLFTGKRSLQEKKRVRAGLAAGTVLLIFAAAALFRLSPVRTSGKAGHLSGVPAMYMQDSAPQTHTAFYARDTVRKLDDLNGREPIWEAAIKVIKYDHLTFFFGVTPIGVSQALISIGGLKRSVAHCHNEMLQMATALGIPMMIAFAVFVVFMCIKGFRLGFLEGKQHFKGAYILPAALASLIVLTLVEAYLFGYFCIMSSLFFLFCGWINALVRNNRQKDSQNTGPQDGSPAADK